MSRRAGRGAEPWSATDIQYRNKVMAAWSVLDQAVSRLLPSKQEVWQFGKDQPFPFSQPPLKGKLGPPEERDNTYDGHKDVHCF